MSGTESRPVRTERRASFRVPVATETSGLTEQAASLDDILGGAGPAVVVNLTIVYSSRYMALASRPYHQCPGGA